MLFNSIIFVFFFLPISCLIYFLTPWKFKNMILLILSGIFYYLSEGKYILLLVVVVGINYILAKFIQHDKQHAKTYLILGLIFNLAILIIFKLQPHLPIGLSFFTFFSISYLIDVYKHIVPAEPNFFNYSTYITFFPYISAGPITRYKTMSNQLRERKIELINITQGIERFIIGFTKKILIANQLAPITNTFFNLPVNELNLILAWIGALCFTMEIYFDFSGYSDMAIGIARIFGFRIPENFNYPYLAISIKDFWTRWHISLSSWLKDYIYIPLGGNRMGKLRANINLLIVFLACGLWHGISANFVSWGAYQAFFMIVENIFLLKLLDKLPRALRVSYSLFIVTIGWVMFRSNNLNHAYDYISKMLSVNHQLFTPNSFNLLSNKSIVSFLVAFIFISPVSGKIGKILNRHLKSLILILLFISSLIMLINSTYSPFIYFRF